MPQGVTETPANTLTSAGRQSTLRLIDAAIAAASPGGTVYNYYVAEAHNLARIKNDAVIIARKLEIELSLLRDEAGDHIRRVASQYRVARTLTDPYALYDDFVTEFRAHGGLFSSGVGPNVLQSDSGKLMRIAEFYTAVLVRNALRGSRRPFSLISKWLHQLYPETFVIYDANASRSIKAWAECVYTHVPPSNPSRLQFDVDNSYWVRNWQDVGWYLGILRFYKTCWMVGTEDGRQDMLEKSSNHLQRLLQREPHSLSRVTIVDVVDGLLWSANGSASILGLKS